jgi:hypothetical protein
LPEKKDKQLDAELNKKALKVLTEKLSESVAKHIKNSVASNNLIAPLYWVLGELIRFLAVVNRKKKPNSKKIKISPSMSVTVENIWNGKGLFKYYAYSDNVPQTLFDLILHMLGIIEKNKPPKGKWKQPYLDKVKYPKLTESFTKNVNSKISAEKKDLKKRVKGKKGIDLVKEYVFSVIKIDKLLSNHVNEIETYYVGVAKNMSKIHNSLKVFFK